TMVACNFGAVFVGIETPDTDSLAITKKSQNTRDPLVDSVTRIARSGLRVMAGFIVGFDNEKPGAGARIVDFVEQTTIPTAAFSMLPALPDTALWHRLHREGRLIEDCQGNLNQPTLTNFIPTRPVEQIAREYIEGFWDLYAPRLYLDRVFRHYMLLKEAKFPRKPRSARRKLTWPTARALLILFWRQGLVRKTRVQFWRNLRAMRRLNPGGVSSYLSTCAQAEHFI